MNRVESYGEIARSTQVIPVYQGPFRGSTPSASKGHVQYGMLRVPAAHASSYEQAREYLSRGPKSGVQSSDACDTGGGDPVMRSHFLMIEDGITYGQGMPPSFSSVLSIEKRGFNGVDSSRLLSRDPEVTVHWSPNHALMTIDGAGISPALILGHELTHLHHLLLDPDAFLFRVVTPVSKYTNREEELTIDREHQTAKKFGEGIRNGHFGVVYKVQGPLDRHCSNQTKLVHLVKYIDTIYDSDNWWQSRSLLKLKKTHPEFYEYLHAQHKIAWEKYHTTLKNFMMHTPRIDHLRYFQQLISQQALS